MPLTRWGRMPYRWESSRTDQPECYAEGGWGCEVIFYYKGYWSVDMAWRMVYYRANSDFLLYTFQSGFIAYRARCVNVNIKYRCSLVSIFDFQKVSTVWMACNINWFRLLRQVAIFKYHVCTFSIQLMDFNIGLCGHLISSGVVCSNGLEFFFENQ